MEEESNVQEKSKTTAQESVCENQTSEIEHSCPIDTFKNQLKELIDLETNFSESAELLLEIANKQVCCKPPLSGSFIGLGQSVLRSEVYHLVKLTIRDIGNIQHKYS